jgi:2-phospho-L-lactate guanylyltransferase (CobY/MobA/RfbA family)
MPKGNGNNDKCRCDVCLSMDENAGLMDATFTEVMQSVWGPVEVEALVTTEECRASASQDETNLSTAVAEWVSRISEKKNENLRNYWLDNKLPPEAH